MRNEKQESCNIYIYIYIGVFELVIKWIAKRDMNMKSSVSSTDSKRCIKCLGRQSVDGQRGGRFPTTRKNGKKTLNDRKSRNICIYIYRRGQKNLRGAIGTRVSKVAVTTLAKNAVSRQALECARGSAIRDFDSNRASLDSNDAGTHSCRFLLIHFDPLTSLRAYCSRSRTYISFSSPHTELEFIRNAMGRKKSILLSIP